MVLKGRLVISEEGIKFYPINLWGKTSNVPFNILKIPYIMDTIKIVGGEELYPYFSFAFILKRYVETTNNEENVRKASNLLNSLANLEVSLIKERKEFSLVEINNKGVRILRQNKFYTWQELINKYIPKRLTIDDIIKMFDKHLLKEEIIYGYRKIIIYYLSKEKGSPILVLDYTLGKPTTYIGAYLGKVELERKEGKWISSKEVPLVVKIQGGYVESDVLSVLPFAYPHVVRTDYFSIVCGDRYAYKVLLPRMSEEHNRIPVGDIIREFREVVVDNIQNDLFRKIIKLEGIVKKVSEYIGISVPEHKYDMRNIDYGHFGREDPDELAKACLENNKGLSPGDERWCYDPKNAIIMIRVK